MLGKLLKYDIKSVANNLLPYYGILTVLAALVRLVSLFKENSEVFQVIYVLINMFFVVAVIALFVYLFVVIVKRYYTNIYKDEGYLTNTLPVSKSSILTSKLITSAVFLLFTVCAALVALFIAYYTPDIAGAAVETLNMLAAQFQVSTGVIILFAALTVLLAYYNYVFLFWIACTFGHKHANSKIGYSVIYGVVVYFAGQIINLIGLGIMFLFNSDFISLIREETTSLQSMGPFLAQTFILSAVVLFIYGVVNYIGVRSGFDIE